MFRLFLPALFSSLHGWDKEGRFFQSHLPTMIKGYESVVSEPAWKGMRNMDLHPKDSFRPDGTIISGNVIKQNIIAALEACVPLNRDRR